MPKQPPVTAAELAARLRADPEFVARQQEQEQARAERSPLLRAEQEPMLADLRTIGLEVNSVWDLVNTSSNYDEAIPTLLKHLKLPYSDRTREGIARALAVPQAKYAWPDLVLEYHKAPMGEENGIRLGAKDGLAVALATTATDAHMEELAALAKDPKHGDSRLLLLRGLRKSKSPTTRLALKELAFDPALAKEIASWEKKKKKKKN